MAIPRVVHQIWLQGEKHLRRDAMLGSFLDSNRVTCGAAAWDLRVWDEADGLSALAKVEQGLGTGDAMRRIYDSAPCFAAKSDILRYAIVYLHGGVYLDTDALLVQRDFGWIFAGDPEVVVCLWSSNVAIERSILRGLRTNNHFFAGTVGNMLCRRVLLRIAGAEPWEGGPDTSLRAVRWVMRTTSPAVMWQVADEMWTQGMRIRFVPDALVDPANWGGGIRMERGSPDDVRHQVMLHNPAALLVHMEEMSWVTLRPVAKVFLEIQNFCRNYYLAIIPALVTFVIALAVAVAVLASRRRAPRSERCSLHSHSTNVRPLRRYPRVS